MSAIEYKCPNCGAALKFDAKSQKIVCEFCGSEFDPEQVKKYNEELSQKAEDKFEWEESTEEFSKEESASLNLYTCNSCGGEVYADANTSATTCPYCGNPVILKGRLQGALKPDYVIPFKNTNEDLIPVMQKYLKKKIFLPGKFKTENEIKEIKGVYVPFWIHDADVDGTVRWKGYTQRTWTSGDYRYTEKKYYSIIRAGKLGFDHIPVDGSQKMPDDLMESIEPFEFDKAVKFEPMYLTGYLSDKYDVDKEQVFPRANQRIKEGTIDQFRTTISTSYKELEVQSTNLSLYNTHVDYALYPVWLMATQYKDKNYMFAMNGQTGKMTGNLPMAKLKAFLLTMIFFLVPMGIGVLLGILNQAPAVIIIGAVIAVIAAIAFFLPNYKALKPVHLQRGAANYYRAGSMVLDRKEDNFLYKTVSKERISSNK